MALDFLAGLHIKEWDMQLPIGRQSRATQPAVKSKFFATGGKTKTGKEATLPPSLGPNKGSIKLECLEPEQVTTAIDCFRKLRTLCKGIRPSSTEKRSHDVRVCADAMPKPLKKARALQTVPTDKSM